MLDTDGRGLPFSALEHELVHERLSTRVVLEQLVQAKATRAREIDNGPKKFGVMSVDGHLHAVAQELEAHSCLLVLLLRVAVGGCVSQQDQYTGLLTGASSARTTDGATRTTSTLIISTKRSLTSD